MLIINTDKRKSNSFGFGLELPKSTREIKLDMPVDSSTAFTKYYNYAEDYFASKPTSTTVSASKNVMEAKESASGGSNFLTDLFKSASGLLKENPLCVKVGGKDVCNEKGNEKKKNKNEQAIIDQFRPPEGKTQTGSMLMSMLPYIVLGATAIGGFFVVRYMMAQKAEKTVKA